VDPTQVDGFAGKYRQGFGTPFDLDNLADDPNLDKNAVRYVRIVDIPGDGASLDTSGDPIYDPFPTTDSAGFDLDGVAVLNGVPSADWKFFRTDAFSMRRDDMSPTIPRSFISRTRGPRPGLLKLPDWKTSTLLSSL
jgi:hypothetical protein